MRQLHLPFLFVLALFLSFLPVRSQSNLYGVTTAGGNGGGSIFSIPTGGTAFSNTVGMVDYSGAGNAVLYPKLIEVNGVFYGVMYAGGTFNFGVLFAYNPVSNTYTTLASFTGTSGAVPGNSPVGNLLAYNGKLYGMTRTGGANNLGTIFSYDIASNTHSVLTAFTGTTGLFMGAQPQGGLMLASNNKMYGLTSLGGNGINNGTIFQFDPASSSHSLMVSFTGTTGLFVGGSPQGCTLIERTTNKLNGVTNNGANGNGAGTLFEYDFSANTYTVLYSFPSSNQVLNSLFKASNNKLYGAVATGTTGVSGAVFEYDPASTTFTRTDIPTTSSITIGSSPRCSFIEPVNGKLYGVCRTGGTGANGTLFEYDIASYTLTKKADFGTTGANPQGALTAYSGNGKWYGVAVAGGLGTSGIIYEYDPNNPGITKKIDFNVSTGGQPHGAMVLSSTTNKLYGTALTGGSGTSGGVIFEYDYTTNTYVKKVDLNTAANGRSPYGGLMQATNNNLYGLMSAGGTSSLGTLIQYAAGGTSVTKLIDFTSATGSQPYGALVQAASNGNLYGLTSTGGANGLGVLFEYNISTAAYTNKYDFTAASGANPYGSLVVASNGKAYGLTSAGGTNSAGVLFEYDIATSTYTKKFDMATATGANPYGSLVQASNGNLYGMTRNGGANGLGVIFEYNISTNTYTKKIDLSSANGSLPYGSLTRTAGGKLYGLTTAGGTNSVGVLFEYDPSTNIFTKKMDLTSTSGALPGYTQLTEICTLPSAASAISSTVSSFCLGNTTVQNFSISAISNATSYVWTLPAGASVTTGSNTNNLNINFGSVAAGVYTVTTAGVNACGTGTTSSKTITINTLPSISASNATICSGNSVTFTPNGASTYTFQGGSAVVSPTTTTIYTITGTDANGCMPAAPTSVTVTVNTTPSISVSGGSICTGGSFTFNPTGATTYSVNGGGGLVVAPGGTTTFSITGSANGCTTPTAALATVTVNNIPTIAASSGSMCSGTVFSISPSGAGTYTVNPGNSLTVSPTGNTTYSVTGTSTAGCQASNTVVVTVSVSTSPFITVNSGSICSSNSFVINPQGADAYTITGNAYTVTPNTTTSYTVNGASSAGCAATNTVVATVTVYTTPTVTASSGSICTNGVYTINTGTIGAGIATATLSGGSFTLSGNNYLVNPSANATYSVSGTSTAGCVSAIAVSNVTVNPRPFLTVSSGSVCSGNIYTITTTSGGVPIATYTVAGGTSTVSGGSLLVSPASGIVYSVTATSTAGCVSGQALSTVFVNTTPTLGLTSGAICQGATYSMNVTSAVGISTYTLTGGSYTVSGNTLLVSPTATGTSVYTVVATSNANCVSGPATSTVTTQSNPTITVNSGSICAGSSFTISPNGAANYIVAGGNLTVSPSTSTNYTVVGNTNGCLSNVVTSSVTVNALPPVAISTASAICAGTQATLIASGANSYSWTPSATGATITSTPSSNTTYSVTGTNTTGCSSTTFVTVIVNSLPNINVPSGAICPGNSFTFSPSGAVTYTYSGGSNVVSPSSTTSYSITGTDANGCTSAMPAIATVTVSSTLPVSISGPNSVCTGGTLVLTAGGASTYSWNTGDASITVTVSPTADTMYTVTGSSGTCSNTATFSVSVLPLPTVSVSGTSSVICAGETAMLSASGALTYTWVNTGQNTSTIAVSPQTATSYTLIGADATCFNVALFTQNVDPCLGLVSSSAPISFQVYPNPNNGEFVIESPKTLNIAVVNALGEVISTQKLTEGRNTINIGTHAKGLYFIQPADNNSFKAVRIAVQ